MNHRIGRSADGRQDADRILERLPGEYPRDADVLLHQLDDPPAGHTRRSYLRASTAGIAALPGMPTPSASIIDAIVDAVPIVMQWPCERCMQDSASWNSSSVSLPHAAPPDIDQVVGPEPMLFPLWYLAGEHRPAGDEGWWAGRRCHAPMMRSGS